MPEQNGDDDGPVKSEEARPVPVAWRRTLSEIVSAFAAGDYELANRVPSVEPVPTATATQISRYVFGYGGTLTELPHETWQTSIAQWTGHDWQVLVDLWTREEGRSDMVLDVNVAESHNGYRFAVHLVYVP